MAAVRKSAWALGVACAVAVAAACHAFSASDESSGGAADADAPDVASKDDARDANTDGAVLPDAGPPPRDELAHCPPPDAPAALPDDTVVLYDGGAPAPTADGGSFPFEIVTDKDHVYWVEEYSSPTAPGDGYDAHADGRILRIAKPGVDAGAGAVPAVLVDHQVHARSLAADGPRLYWVVDATSPMSPEVRSVARDCKAPCAPVTETLFPFGDARQLLRVAPGVIVAASLGGAVNAFRTNDGGLPPIIAPTGGPAVITSTADAIYVSAAGHPTIDVYPLGAAATSKIAAPNDGGIVGSDFLATDCSRIFTVNAPEHTVDAMLPDGGGRVRFAPALPGGVYTAVADARFVYFGGPNNFGILALRLDDGTPSVVTTDPVYGMAVDADGVYWGVHRTAPNAGVLKMLKKR